MKTTRRLNVLTAALVGVLAFSTAQAQQYPIPTTAAEVPDPPSGTAMTTAYVQSVGRMAYLWGWPLVNVATQAFTSDLARRYTRRAPASATVLVSLLSSPPQGQIYPRFGTFPKAGSASLRSLRQRTAAIHGFPIAT